MQDFKIGQLVSFDHIAESIYEGNDKKVIFSEIQPLKGLIVGRATRQEGTYHKESCGGVWNDGEYDPAYLSVSKVIPLWEVKISWRNRPLLVSDDHAKPISEEFTLLNQVSGPVRIIKVEV